MKRIVGGMRYFVLYVVFGWIGAGLAACSQPAKTGAAAAVAAADTIPPAGAVEELPLPNVPETLRTPAERAAYVIEHFWDGMDFSDARRSHNEDFMEQNFVNYVNLFPYAEMPALEKAVESVMQKALADEEAYSLFVHIAEKYLYDPNSPMFSEDFYELFLQQLLKSATLSETGMRRYTYQLETVRKNRPGTVAADFAYVNRNGSRSTLLGTVRNGQYTLLAFYDPDCSHCKEIMGMLQEEPALTAAVQNRKVQVVAIYADEDRELWESTAPGLPAAWTVGYNEGSIYDDDLYSLRALPSLYLLNEKGQILLKDLPANHLPEVLANLP